MAAYSFLTRCDRALAASHCLSRVQRLKPLDVRTYSHMAELALTNELLATPLAALATHHNWYKPFLMLVSFFFYLSPFPLLLIRFLVLSSVLASTPQISAVPLTFYFFTVPFPCPTTPGQRPMTPPLPPLPLIVPAYIKCRSMCPLQPKPPT